MVLELCHRLLVAVQQGHADTVSLLLEETECSPDGLFGVMQPGEPASVARPFGTRGADGAALQVQILHNQNVHLDSSLHFACIGAHVEIAEILLKAGCSPNLRNVQGHTPLHYAVRANNADLVRLLMRFGADPDIATLTTKNTPLHRAAALGCGAAVDGILDSCGIEVDVTLRNQQGNTPSMEAASALRTHCRRFDTFVSSPELPSSTAPPAQLHRADVPDSDAVVPGEAAPPEEQAGTQGIHTRGVVCSRRRKRGAVGAASFQALRADPAALCARTAELQHIAARLLTIEEDARRAVPEVHFELCHLFLVHFCFVLMVCFAVGSSDTSCSVLQCRFETFVCSLSRSVQRRLAWTKSLLGDLGYSITGSRPAATDDEASRAGITGQPPLSASCAGPRASASASVARSVTLSPDLVEMVGLRVSHGMVRQGRRGAPR